MRNNIIAQNRITKAYENINSYRNCLNVFVDINREEEIALNKLKNWQYLRIFGYNPDIDIGVEETFWTLGGTYNYATSGETLFASSSSTADTNKRILVTGLDIDFNVITGSCVLNGQNTIQITGSSNPQFYRINSIVGDNFPSLTAGQVYIYPNTTVTAGVPSPLTTVRGHIEIGATREFLTRYTVPINHTLLLKKILVNTNTATNGQIIFKSRLWDSVNKFNKVLAISSKNNIGNNVYEFKYEAPIIFQEKSELEITATTLVNNSVLACTLEGFLVHNDSL